jgi:molybdate transport system permease protein
MVRGRHPQIKYNPFFIFTGILTLGIVLYLTLPLFALFFRTTPELLYASLLSPMMRNALRLSLVTTCITTVLIVLIGTPAAYVQSRADYPGKKIIDTCIDLPIVLPPAVAGFALLLMYGRMGLLGQYLYAYGIKIPFTTTAVIMAQLFVAAPLYIRHATSVFSQMNKNYEETAQTLGAGSFRTFRTITLPLTYIGLLSGATTAYARALGEFGATIMFAGNLPGVTQTMPLAIYTSMQSDLNSAVTLSILLIISSLVIMLVVRYISGKEEKNAYL